MSDGSAIWNVRRAYICCDTNTPTPKRCRLQTIHSLSLSLSLSFSTLDYWITLCRVTMSQVFSSRFGCFRVWYSDTLGAGSDTWTPKRNEDRKNHVQLGRTSAPRIPFSRTYLDRTGPCTPQRPCTPLVFLIGLLAARGRVGGGIGGWRVDSLGLDVFFATG